jgi:hypothetical protein
MPFFFHAEIKHGLSCQPYPQFPLVSSSSVPSVVNLFILSDHLPRLDLPRSQMRNQFPVRRQKIVSRQFLRQHPRDLLKHPRRNFLLRNLRRKKMNLQFLLRIRILVPHPPDLPAFQNRDAQLFSQLPRQRLFQSFALSNLASGKLPLQRGAIIPPPLSNQQPPVPSLHHCCHHQSHKAYENSRHSAD